MSNQEHKEFLTRVIYEFKSDSRESPPPDSLLDFRDWLNNKIETIPDGFRRLAKIELEAEAFYNSGVLNISIYYMDVESDEEYAERMRNKAIQESRTRERELFELARLKSIYERGREDG